MLAHGLAFGPRARSQFSASLRLLGGRGERGHGGERVTPIRFTLRGQAASKSNQRMMVTIGGRSALIKSPEARAFVRGALMQIPTSARQRLEGPIRIALRIFYASNQPDLDEQLVLDVLQDQWSKRDASTKERKLLQAGVYRNDRQIVRRYCEKAIDAKNPRVEVLVVPVAPQQAPEDLFAALERAEREAAEEF